METKPFGAMVRERREAAGLSISEMRDALRDRVPDRYVPSISTLSRWETGQVNDKRVDGIVIVGLARVFGCRVSELSPEVASELDRTSDLLASCSPWNPIPAEQLDLFAAAAA